MCIRDRLWSDATAGTDLMGRSQETILSSTMNDRPIMIDSTFTDLIRPNSGHNRKILRDPRTINNDAIIDKAINSVDGDDEDDDDDDDTTTEEDEDDSRSNSNPLIDKQITLKETQKFFKFKEGSNFHYDGPFIHHETEFPYDPEKNDEHVLSELEFNGAPGLIFELIFSETNHSFLLEFLKSQESSEISPIGSFDKVGKDGFHFRDYSYIKKLNFSVGPKSTNCDAEETLIHQDNYDYINIVNTTRTPNVPSGKSFSTKARYMFRWGSNTTCVLKISYWVDWTGSSWIKPLIESSVKTGMTSSTEDLVKQLGKYVEDYVEEVEVDASMSTTEYAAGSIRHEQRSVVSEKNISLIDEKIFMKDESMRKQIEPVKLINPSGKHIRWIERYLPFILIAILILFCINVCYIIHLQRTISRLETMITMPNHFLATEREPVLSSKIIDIPAKFDIFKRWIHNNEGEVNNEKVLEQVYLFLRSILQKGDNSEKNMKFRKELLERLTNLMNS